uniref:Uncharacterized protein n=1 Tax=Meloidogyne enterolobii TaxID=390850 RepID=A0A6V7U0T7_MELEN|nr:unnamed protein product [Meloidogyne enterolobii]
MNQTHCKEAEASLLNTGYNVIRACYIIFGLIVLLLLVWIVISYKTKPIKFHPNLIILVCNVFLLYAILVVSYMLEAVLNFIVLFTYSDPCDCLTQVWVVYLIRMPAYMYIAGSPLFHLTIMIERVLATVYVKIYENQGKKIGVISTIIVWLLILLFGIYIYFSTQIDVNTFSHTMVYLTLTSSYNSQIYIYLHFFLLFLVICISMTDYFLIYRNKKIKSNFSIINYSLSQSYQSKQNILVMTVIFPLDFSYSFAFALYNILSSFIRYKRDEYGQLIYVRALDGIVLILFIHAILTLLVYDYFLKKQNEIRKNFVKNNMNMNHEIYFKNLNYAWK